MTIPRLATLIAVLGFTVAVAQAEPPSYRTDQAAGDAAQIAHGQEKFMMCVGCHGTEGEGKVGTAPALNSGSYLTVVSNDLLKKTIIEGRAGTTMIGWGPMLADEDITGLVAFVRSWQTSDGVELDTSPLKGEVADGEKLYREICATCHGRSGAGYQESGSGSGIGRKGFLDQVSDGEIRGVIKLGKDNTPMRPFAGDSPVAVANLTDEQIDGIIKYLRLNAW